MNEVAQRQSALRDAAHHGAQQAGAYVVESSALTSRDDSVRITVSWKRSIREHAQPTLVLVIRKEETAADARSRAYATVKNLIGALA